MTAIQEHDVLTTIPGDLLIGGAWRPSSSGATFGVFDPADGSVIKHAATL